MAQSAFDSMVITAGTTWHTNNTEWAYLLWQARAPELLNGRAFAIYRKPGAANSPALYDRTAIVTMQTHPTAIEVLLNRAKNIGDDLVALEDTITSLFQSLMPPAGAQLKDKVAIVLQGAKGNPDHLKNLLLLSRVHPGISLCLGFAHAEPLPGTGLFTHEIRAFDLPKNQDLAVIGRVTVDAGNPLKLPAPGPLVQVPDLAEHLVQGHLNAKFRWATSPDLRRLTFLNYGFNLYRVTKAFAEHPSRNYHVTPPSPETLNNLLNSHPNEVKRVNVTPVLKSKDFTAADVDPSMGDAKTFFTADDNRRYDPGGVPHQNGAEFYYFLTARDILGRDGFLSPGLYVKICDRFPPDPPRDLVIDNFYAYDEVTQTKKQVLRVKWKQHINTPEETVVKYHLYRWLTPIQAIDHANDPNVLIQPIKTVNHVNGAETLTLLDENLPGSPQMPADASKTFWYTVRAEDNGACGGNLSGHSSPAFGVLRDREGPETPSGTIFIRCCDPRSDHDETRDTPGVRLNPLDAHFELAVSRHTPEVQRVEFFAFDPTQSSNLIFCAASGTRAGARPADCLEFPAGVDRLTVNWSVPRARMERRPVSFFARSYTVDGDVSEFAVARDVGVPAVGQVRLVSFTARRDCITNRLVSTIFLDPDCIVHHPNDPNDNSKIPIKICVDLNPSAKEWRLYRRVDDGPISLLKQGLADFNVVQQVCVDDFEFGINPGKICYYAQLFDEHGNASPLALLKCIPIAAQKPKPLLAPLEPAGDSANPTLIVRWFCKPYGLERFLVHISDSSLNPPAQISVDLSEQQDVASSFVFVDQLLWPVVYGIYQTPMVGPGFGQGAQFSVSVGPIKKNTKYRVRIQALGKDGKKGNVSNLESLTWHESFQPGPEVPWPALALPPVSELFSLVNPNMTAVLLQSSGQYLNPEYPVGIRIGEVPVRVNGTDHPFVIEGQTDPTNYLYKGVFGFPLFPVALYRYQVPNAEFPTVSGDLIQVSPLMEKIAYQKGDDPTLGPSVFVHDPFIAVHGPGHVLSAGPSAMYLLDTQPVIEGARYSYLLVRLGLNKEIFAVLPVGEVEVTP